ncbi:MAG TPA: helix-turn-helix transcriptional regulator [Paracoccaceae bacterium]|nr:helix-turn-helix transcriptional regulator [Paracoccaceae bacterium]
MFAYQPQGRALDVEVFRVTDLRQRTSAKEIRTPHRYDFYMLVCVTHGHPTQWVDFQPVPCAPGSLLVLRPGQVHGLGEGQDWDGWLVLFRSEFLPSDAQTTADLRPVLGLDQLPEHMVLGADDFDATREMLARMQQDATRTAAPQDIHALLRYQLCAVLVRLCMVHDHKIAAEPPRSQGLQRFVRFRKLVEQNFTRWHQVANYADTLGCTEKSLTRAAREASGQNAKAVIAARITLEAKRLLAHTDRPIYLIAEGLGFAEATNFAKFFRRETGLTPAEFRAENRG